MMSLTAGSASSSSSGPRPRFKEHSISNAKAVFGNYNDPTSLCEAILEETRGKGLNLIFIDPTDCSVPFGLLAELKKTLKNVDFIVHAGDLVDFSVIDELEQIAPVLAVHGNMDLPEVCSSLPALNSLKVFDWKIGVMHDPKILHDNSEMNMLTKQYGFNAFVYGHTHSSRILWENKTLYINPGSPTDPASLVNKPSVGILKLTKTNIFPQIIEL
jgi:putative phosphoesterase